MVDKNKDESEKVEAKQIDLSPEDSVDCTVLLSGLSATQQALQFATTYEERKIWKEEYTNASYAYQNFISTLVSKYLDEETKKSIFGSPEINIYNQTMLVHLKPDYLILVPEHKNCTKH